MIKLFVWIGVIGTTAIAYLATYGVAPEAQLPPEITQLAMFEEEGLMPNTNNLEENPELEHGIFEVPEEDAVYLAAALEGMSDMNMSGMDMSGSGDGAAMNMDMDGDGTMDMSSTEMAEENTEAMDMSGSGDTAMNMDMDGDGVMDMSSSDMAMGATNAMDMSSSGDTAMNMDMDMDGDGVMDMSSSDMTKTTTNMGDTGSEMEEAMEAANGGLYISEADIYDREFTLTMQEWGYSDMEIDVKMGERIKFTVKNGGQIPHEFMFMNMALMSAVDYRLTRADWSLLEHEALFEQALVLPGGEFTFTVQIMQPGSWMFMCMLPYHMQMGMMGQMATEGMAMDMQM